MRIPPLRKALLFFSTLCSLLFLTGCDSSMMIINEVDEREANEIIVFLASKGIASDKSVAVSTAPGGAEGTIKYSISVDASQELMRWPSSTKMGCLGKKERPCSSFFLPQGS